MNRTVFGGIVSTLISVACSATLMAQATPKLTPASSPSASKSSSSQFPLPVPDKGTFRILLAGAEVGTEQFAAESAGSARILRSETVLHAPGQPLSRSSGELRVAADGSPLGYKWSSQAEKKVSGSVDFKGGAAQTLLDMGNGKEPFQADFMFSSPHVAVLDNNLYYQYALLAQLYDWNAKGRQVFPVLIPQDMTPGNISVESLGEKKTDGGTFETLRVNTADLEILAYYDSRRRLMRVEVPAAMVAIVRR